MLKYDLGKDEYKDWLVAETEFNVNHLGKCEAIMALGNGYLGMRSALDEKYFQETRNTFVSGTFNKFDEFEVTELPNVADVSEIVIKIDDEYFSLETGTVNEYVRILNIKEALLKREVSYTTKHNKTFKFIFKRFVSLANLHLIASFMEIEAVNANAKIEIISGINGQKTNSGSQHFHEGEKRIFAKKYIQFCQTTTESKIDFVINVSHKLLYQEKEIGLTKMEIERRVANVSYSVNMQRGTKIQFEKLATVHTSRDLQFANMSLAKIKEISLANIKEEQAQGFAKLLEKHLLAWDKKVWKNYLIYIDSTDSFDQLAIRFAIYHLTIMCPAHDSRMGIAAKGLSGEGYKGHSFWDTEVFILPFFIYSNPKVARGLLEYRFKGLEGARKKAQENNYAGAMYPWEAAWPSDGEVTPVWGAVDIITGKQTKIWSGFIEQHITSIIANAVWQYYAITNDDQFMDLYGYEIIMDTATFWASRLEYNNELDRYDINNVIGPDEYKEHVNNNAFTNYMAAHNIKLAIKYYDELKRNNSAVLERLEQKLALKERYDDWHKKLRKIYLPEPNEKLIVAQDDTYLRKKIIDLTKYKKQTKIASLFSDYNLEQVNEMQISKQADIMILFYLLENLFSNEVKIANFNYYEPKTLHDSSLSLSTHSILASDLDNLDLAYDLFKRACNIDLGPLMNTSNHGIHAASLGGIWQCVVMGFAGLRMLDGRLRITPKLPKTWNELKFNFSWQGYNISCQVSHKKIILIKECLDEVGLLIQGQSYFLKDKLEVEL